MSCAACCTVILDGEDFLRCTQEECGKRYHYLCTGGSKPAESSATNLVAWICPECNCKSKRGGDNSHTPVGVSKKTRDSNITYRKKVDTELNTEFHLSLSSEIHSLRLEVSVLKDQLTQAVSLISRYETKLEKYTSAVETLHSKLDKSEVYHTAAIPSLQSKPKETSPVKTSNLKRKYAAKKSTQTTLRPVQQVHTGESTQSGSSMSQSSIHRDAPTQLPSTQDAEDRQQWTEVRRNRRPASLCGTAGPTITTLRAVEPRSYIHLWNMESSVDDIREYLRQLCPGGSCTVVELSTKGDYKSYKIGVPVAYHETCMSADVWPVNARLKKWIVYNRKPMEHAPRNSTQPFRCEATTQ